MDRSLLEKARKWRQDALNMGWPEDNIWLEALAFMDDEALVNEYRSFEKVFGISHQVCEKLHEESD